MKNIYRIIMLVCLSLCTIISYSFDFRFWLFFYSFMLGFVVSAIIAKEKNNLLVWAGGMGISMGKLDEEKDVKK